MQCLYMSIAHISRLTNCGGFPTEYISITSRKKQNAKVHDYLVPKMCDNELVFSGKKVPFRNEN